MWNPLRRSQPKQRDTAPAASPQIKAVFDQPEGVSAFCLALQSYRMSYVLAGDNTVIVDERDLAYLHSTKHGVLKDYPPKLSRVTPFHQLSPTAKAEAIRNRLISKSQLLENLRKPLRDIS